MWTNNKNQRNFLAYSPGSRGVLKMCLLVIIGAASSPNMEKVAVDNIQTFIVAVAQLHLHTFFIDYFAINFITSSISML
jgi:hypothetical protein